MELGRSSPGCGRRTLQTPDPSTGLFPESPPPSTQFPAPRTRFQPKSSTKREKPNRAPWWAPRRGHPPGAGHSGAPSPSQCSPTGAVSHSGAGGGGPCNIPLGCSNPQHLTTEIFFAGCLLPRAGISVPVAMATWASPWEPARDGESCKHKTGQKQAAGHGATAGCPHGCPWG